jgi:hypothetical protein
MADTNTTNQRPKTRWTVLVWGGLVSLWLLPLAAMQVTKEVAWTTFDFVVWGAMLGAAGGAFELALRASGGLAYRAGFAIAVMMSFLMVWANLAVGIIGNEDNAANLLFFGVPMVGVIGACVARLKAGGMFHAMVATAAAQGAVGVFAFVAGWGATPVLTVVWGGAWLLSAWLFRAAARTNGA